MQVVGDVAKPFFGLEKDAWLELASRVSHIVHCAARVDALLPYQQLRAPNVVGTMEVLRLRQASNAFMIHVSSAAVYNAYRVPLGGFQASFSLDPSPTWQWMSGYSQSKWIAEHLVRQGGGKMSAIVRPGIISHCSVTGHANLQDFDTRFALSCLELGVAPDCHGPLAGTPVDVLANVIGNLLVNEQTGSINVQYAPQEEGVEHDDLGCLVEALKLPLIPYSEWRRLVAANPKLPLSPLLDMLGQTSFPTRSGASLQSSVQIARPPQYWCLLSDFLQNKGCV